MLLQIPGDRVGDQSVNQTMRYAGAVLAIIGGGLRIVAAFVPYTPQSPALEVLYAVIDLCFLFGLGAIYWPVSARLGCSGLGGFVLATAGIASIVGPDARMFGLEFYLVGSIIFELGLLWLSIPMVLGNIHRWTGLLWVASLAAGGLAMVLGGSSQWLAVAGIALGAGYILAGWNTAKQLSRAGRTPGTAMAFNQITLGCNDLAASIDFYSRLGLRLIVDSPANGYARFEAPNESTLSIHQGLPVPAGAVVYFEHPQLDQWIVELKRDGVVIDQAPCDQSWGWREAHLQDPAGNPICLYWAGKNRRFPPWRVVG